MRIHFFRAGFIEACGKGIETIKESFALAGNPLLEYTVKPTEIMVMFQTSAHHVQSKSLSESMSELDCARFTVVEKYLKTHETITTASAARLQGVQDKIAHRLLVKAEILRILSGESKTKDKVYRKNWKTDT